MNSNAKETEEWEDFQFVIDAAHEVIDLNFENTIAKMREGIGTSLLEIGETVETRKLMQALVFLIAAVEKIAQTYGIPELGEAQKIEPSKCGFCGLAGSETKLIVAGAYGNICDSCIRDAYKNLETYEASRDSK